MEFKRRLRGSLVKKKLEIILLLFLLFIGLFYMLKVSEERDFQLNGGEVKYTVGKIVEFEWGAKTNPYFKYEFFVENEKYYGRYDIVDSLAIIVNVTAGNDMKKISQTLNEFKGKKCLVKYSVKNIDYNELLINKVVLDSL